MLVERRFIMPENIRPTKKQRQLLEFIEKFIAQHGYSPSYREIMQGCNYNSVATVALHVNNLIKRGHLQKRDNSARSLEVLNVQVDAPIKSNQVSESEEKWLVEKVEYFFAEAERSSSLPAFQVDRLYVLVGALKVLGLDGAANSFLPRLSNIKNKKKK